MRRRLDKLYMVDSIAASNRDTMFAVAFDALLFQNTHK